MKKLLVLIPFLLIAVTSVEAQLGKKQIEKAYDKMKVPYCSINNVKIMKGDTITIGQPSVPNQKYSFITRRLEWYDGTPDIEKLRLTVEWSNRKVIVDNTYSSSDGLNNICYAQFTIAKDVHAWITLDNAIQSKEIVKLNNKAL